MSEVEKKIEECIAEMEPYRYYSWEADEGIKGMKELQKLIANLNEENLEEVLKKVTDAYRRALQYSSYVPKTVSNLKYIKEWLEKQK